MAYASASDVAALTPQLISPQKEYTIASSPTLANLNSWLSSGCSVIELQLSAKGYSVPVSEGTIAYDFLRELNALYAAYLAENARTNIVLGAGERSRATQFEKQFWSGIDRLLAMDLTMAGVDKTGDAPMYIGGISYSAKDVYDDNTDRIGPRFKRNQFGFPGVVKPDKFSASGIDDGDD